ncbi:unnamed protein product [Peniophora sp. CBMAI 1063]|nr:unnamed protein product [Peniophora sp. CBMAI 1063]
MSFHHGTPASYTSDYGVLAHYAAHRDAQRQADGAAVREETDSEHATTISDDEVAPGEEDGLLTPRPRRTSFPTSYLTVPPTLPSTLPPNMREAVANEYTPLLIPRIPEDSDVPVEIDTGHHWWDEARILVRYTLPVFGTHLLEYSLQVASVIAIGHLSTNALAAGTLGTMTASVTGFSIVQGFASTLDTMLPSAWTSDNPRLVGLWAQRMTVVMAICLIPIFAIWFNAEAILLMLQQEPEIARLAGLYLKYVSIGLPAYAFNSISRRYFQSQGLFTVPTQIILVVAPLNAFLNWLLVWGPAPFRLGFIGAPLASAISMNLVSLASIVYGVFFHPEHGVASYLPQELPELECARSARVGRRWIGPEALATQSVLLVSASTTYQAPFALSVAASVRIGNLLGERNAPRAALCAKLSLLLSLGFSAISCAMFLFFRKDWARLFNDDPIVVALVASILPVVALFQVFDGLSAVTGGVLRARGKQFTGALLNLSAYYVVGIPFGVWLAFNRDFGLHGLWYGLTLSLVYSGCVGAWLALTTDWANEVEKVIKRLKSEEHAGDLEGNGVRQVLVDMYVQM